MTPLILAIAAIAISLVALGILVAGALEVRRALLEAPTARNWNDLRGRVEDLEADSEQLHERLNKRARQGNMETARNARTQQSDVLAQAREIAEKQGTLPGVNTAREAGPPALSRESLRASMIKGGKL